MPRMRFSVNINRLSWNLQCTKLKITTHRGEEPIEIVTLLANLSSIPSTSWESQMISQYASALAELIFTRFCCWRTRSENRSMQRQMYGESRQTSQLPSRLVMNYNCKKTSSIQRCYYAQNKTKTNVEKRAIYLGFWPLYIGKSHTNECPISSG